MACAEVGFESWLFVTATTALVLVFVVRARQTQAWLRAHPRGADGLGLMFGFQVLLEERRLWAFRLIMGPIPVVLWLVSLLGVYCYFHGPN